MTFDLAILETGNGGDLQIIGSDLAVVKGIENMPYLGMFGGNVEQSTTSVLVADSKDWWGNRLLMESNQSIQFNSIVEKALNTTSLTSAGRVIIENAIKEDLKFLSPQATVEVSVTIVATDRINVKIKVGINVGGEQIIIINFRKSVDGDWFLTDFNNDFLI